MSSRTVTFDGAASCDGRGFTLGDGARLLRKILFGLVGGLINGIGAVAFVAVLATVVTVAAAWMVHASLAANGRIFTPARSGPGVLTLGYDPNATGSAARPQIAIKTAAEFYARYVVDVPQSRVVAATARPTAPLQTARLERAAPLTAPAVIARVNRIPLPHARPNFTQPLPQPEIARAPVVEPAPKVAALVPSPPPAAVEKPVAPRQAQAPTVMSPEAGARTAVYDIASAMVYMPNGEKLEAHSGLYDKLDDPRYVNVRMRGPTPPNVYDLSLREQLFHGVRAIRLNPLDEKKMHGRDGILAHTYMLGPNGQSNGCVSFKDYRKFLQAFLDGKVDRMVVVPALGNTSWRVAAQQGGARSGPPRRYAASLADSGDDDEPRYTGTLGYAAEQRGAGNW